MKKYLAINEKQVAYDLDLVPIHCLLRVSVEPISFGEYAIISILDSNNGIHFESDGGTIQWLRSEDRYDRTALQWNTTISAIEGEDRFIEFETDEEAVLWYKLN